MRPLALALLALALPSAAQDCPGGQALSRDDLAGATALSDLLLRLDGVARTTGDGLAWRAHAGGALPFADPAWLVLLDGVPVTTGPFGETNLELLPVALGEIERVELCPGPALAAGRFTGHGQLRIRTGRLRASGGPTVRAAAQIGNESGDPGPRQFLPGPGGNVDKLGPDVEAAVAFPGAGAGARFLRRFPTDPAALARNLDALGSYPTVYFGAAGMRAAPPRLPVRLDAGGAYAADLWFVDAAGRELPADRIGGQAALTAGGAVGGWAVGARAGLSAAALDRRSGLPSGAAPGFDPGWREASAWGDVEVRRAGPPLAAGLHLRGTRAEGTGLDGARLGLGRLWLHAAPDGWTADLALVGADGRVGVEAAVGAARRLPGGGRLTLTLAHDARLPEEDAGLAYWRARGYTGLDRPATPYTPAAAFGRGAERTARLDAHVPLTARLRLRASAVGRDVRGLVVERGAFQPDTAFVAGAVAALPGQRGRTLALHAAADGARGPWTLRAAYRFEAALSGTDAFRDVWRAVPRHLGRLTVGVRPDAGFALRLSAEARSATRWPAFAAFDGVVYVDAPGAARDRAYSPRVPGALRLDLEAEKGLFGGRLRLTLAAQNLLDVEERYHPLGADLAFRLWTRAAVRL